MRSRSLRNVPGVWLSRERLDGVPGTVLRVRLIVARCEVRYFGRVTAVLPMALRLLMVKSDGSVMVHADTGGYKPQKSN